MSMLRAPPGPASRLPLYIAVIRKRQGATIPRRDFDLEYVEALPGDGALSDTFTEKEEDSEDRS